MKHLIIIINIIFIVTLGYSQSTQHCISCNGNEINYSQFASGIGIHNIATGSKSFVGGEKSIASGNYSHSFGLSTTATGNHSIAFGNKALASGINSFALGKSVEARGDISFSIGHYNIALANSNFQFGRYLKSIISNNVTIGSGVGPDENMLINDQPGSLMVGFNSINPTLFVSSGGGVNNELTGNVGIGNMTNPSAKLHILGDDDPSSPNDASLFIESAGNFYSSIFLGDTEHSIQSKPNADFTFQTSGDKKFLFKNGDVEIGTLSNPAALIVRGSIQTEEDATFEGNVEIGSANSTLSVNGDISFSGELVNNNMVFNPSPWENINNDIYFDKGKVGIGTNSPSKTLEVNGTFHSTDKVYIANNVYLVDGDTDHTLKVVSQSSGLYCNLQLGSGPIIQAHTGALGIGKTPNKTLDISGSLGVSEEAIFQDKIAIGDGIKLYGSGEIWAKEIKVSINCPYSWSDYVFEENYPLPSLDEVNQYISINKHLPGIPSADEVVNNGINLGQMDALLLKKIEELTLYVIDLERKIESLQP